MSRSSDVSAIISSTVSVGVGTDSTLGMVERVDKAVQTDEFEISSLDSPTVRKERERPARTCFIYGSTDHLRKRCPF